MLWLSIAMFSDGIAFLGFALVWYGDAGEMYCLD